MFFELEETEQPSNSTFEYALYAALLLVAGVWIYLFQVYPLVKEQASKRTFKISITHTTPTANQAVPKPELIEEITELESPDTETQATSPKENTVSTTPSAPTKKNEAHSDSINIHSLIEEIVSSHSQNTNKEQDPNNRVFSPSMRNSIDEARTRRVQPQRESGLPFADGRHDYTDSHRNLHVISDSGCRFRQMNVPDSDDAVWFSEGCIDQGMKFEYKSDLPIYPSFENAEKQKK